MTCAIAFLCILSLGFLYIYTRRIDNVYSGFLYGVHRGWQRCARLSDRGDVLQVRDGAVELKLGDDRDWEELGETLAHSTVQYSHMLTSVHLVLFRICILFMYHMGAMLGVLLTRAHEQCGSRLTHVRMLRHVC